MDDKNDVAERRRELACIEFEIAMEDEDGGRKFCVEDINEKLAKEGLPPFASHDEMMQLVNKQWDLEANAMRAILRFLKETGLAAWRILKRTRAIPTSLATGGSFFGSPL